MVTTSVETTQYICIYIQSASEDNGCRLFFYRIYEEYHINLCEYLMYGCCKSLIPSQGYDKIHIQSVYSVIGRKFNPG